MSVKPEAKKPSEEAGRNLGVLFTGYAEKQNPVSGVYKKRFLVLTQESLHWFIRTEGYDLFGEEKGHVCLSDVIAVRVLDEDSCIFEVKSENEKRRLYRCASSANCSEWVSAMRSAIKALGGKRRTTRRATLSNFRSLYEEPDDANDGEPTVDVSILLVSIRSKMDNTEVVVARNPEWNHIIFLSHLRKGDELVISTSNGGVATLTWDTLISRADENMEFDQPVQEVTLASSIRMKLDMIDANGVSSSGDSPSPTNGSRSKNSDLVATVWNLLSQDRRHTVTLMLSMMTIMILFSNLGYITSESALLIIFTILVTLQCMSYVLCGNSHGRSFGILNLLSDVSPTCACGLKATKTVRMSLFLIAHAFTSPDAPVHSPEDDIPQRFVDGCMGDLKEARRRWDITRKWRETERINDILQEEQPHFFTIKAMYPHYHCGHGKLGHVVFYERPGELEIPQLTARGIRMEEMLRHWLFLTEYQWNIMCNADETAKSIAVIDIEKIKMGDLSGDTLEFIRKTIGYANAHYPERSYVIYIVNAPVWFSMLWKIIKPLVHENTQKKVRILSKRETLPGLQEHIDLDQIPEYYGGHLKFEGGTASGVDSCRFLSPETLALNEYVRNINESFGVMQRKPFGERSNKRPSFNGGALSDPSANPNGKDGLSPPGNRGDPLDSSNIKNSSSKSPLHRTPSRSNIHSPEDPISPLTPESSFETR